ncbi:MAG TPA: hypothetical protein VFW98_06445 [Gemmatimonadaceae bacterium]|nr:hypothetical protein [Gemmatimonadaceae bacterium]
MFSRIIVVAVVVALAACASGHPESSTPHATTPQPVYVRSSYGGSMAIASVAGTAGGYARTIAAPIARSWKALAAAYDSLGIHAVDADPASHRLGNHHLQLHRKLGKRSLSDYLNCGKGLDGYPHANAYAISLDVMTHLTPVGSDSTMVQTQVQAVATPMSGLSSTQVDCTSTGLLEEQIRNLVEAYSLP